MERQRVMYFAKSRDPKVITPKATKRPLSSPSWAEQRTASDRIAPLASLEGDTLDCISRKDGGNIPFSLGQECGSVSRTKPPTLQSFSSDIALENENPFFDLKDFSPPRTFVKQRSRDTREERFSQSEILKQNGECIWRSSSRQSTLDPPAAAGNGYRIPSDPSGKGYPIRNDHPGSATPANYKSQTLPSYINSNEDIYSPRKVPKLSNGPEKRVSSNDRTSTQKRAVCSNRDKVTSKNVITVAPKLKNVNSTVNSGFKPGSVAVHRNSHDSTVNLSGFQNVKQNGAQTSIEKAVSLNNSRLKYPDNTSLTYLQNERPGDETTRGSSHPVKYPNPVGCALPDRSLKPSPQQAAATRPPQLREFEDNKQLSPSTLPEMVQPFSFQVQHQGPLPEMYSSWTTSNRKTTSSSPRTTSSNPRTTSSNQRTTSSNPRATSSNQRTTSSNQRTTPDNNRTTPDNNRTTPDNNRTTPDNKRTTPDNKRTAPDNNRTTPDNQWKHSNQTHPQCLYHYNGDSVKLVVDDEVNMNKSTIISEDDKNFCTLGQSTTQHNKTDSEGHFKFGSTGNSQMPQPEDHTLHKQQKFVASTFDHLDAADLTPNWKRNSLRLATLGYTSMSDLTSSLECLTLDTRQFGGKSQGYNWSLGTHRETLPNYIHEDAQNLQAVRPVQTATHHELQSLTSADTQDAMSELDTFELGMMHVKASARLERDGMKRLSYKMATSDVGCMLGEGERERLHSNSQIPSSTRNHGSGNFKLLSPVAETKTSSDNFTTINPLSPGNADKQNFLLDNATEEEHSNKIKRRSFMLATASLSDLTSLEEELDISQVSVMNATTVQRQHPDADVSMKVSNDGSFLTPESQDGRPRNSSFSSSRLNSSFGSFYTCRSFGSDGRRQSPASDSKPQHPMIRDLRETTHPRRASGSREREESDTGSSDTSFYCTGSSDASFNTANGSPLMQGKKPAERKPTSQDQRWRAYKNGQPFTGNDMRDNGNLPARTSFVSHREKIPSSPIDAVLQCYGCGGSKQRTSTAAHNPWSNNNHPGSLSNNVNTQIKDIQRQWSREDIQRNHSKISSDNFLPRKSNFSPRALQRRIPAFPTTDAQLRDLSFSSGIPPTPSSGSLSSFIGDTEWDETPRFPPSLGRPRRKLYAGFDSQPLPMDSFLSDSSSVYSIQSCGSWGTSRSAEVEGSPRTPEISPNVRAVSSMASNTYTSARRVSEGNVIDFLSYTDKRSVTCENNHNVYLNRESPSLNDCMKVSFYDKKYSNESLESFRSDETTIEVGYDSDANISEYTKSNFNPQQHSGSIYNNGVLPGNEKMTNEKYTFSRLNNSCGSEFGSRLSATNGKKSTENTEMSSSMPKRKYFSTKDVFDLLMASERTSQKGSHALDRQAQKMCEVILCCNQVDRPSAREYHF